MFRIQGFGSRAAWRAWAIVMPFAAVLAWPAAVVAITPGDAAAYRAELVGVVDAWRSLRLRAGSDAPMSAAQLDRAAAGYAALADDDIARIALALPPDRLRRMTAQIHALLALPPATRDIDVPEPDVSPAFCANYPGAVAISAVAAGAIADAVISSMEYGCLQAALGFTVGLACEAPEIVATSAEITSELSSFCFDQVRAAKGRAELDRERAIGQHLETQLDVALSTLAAQDASDAAAGVANDARSRVVALRTQLGGDATANVAQFARAVADLDRIAGVAGAIAAQDDDIAFRLQATQTDIEDAQARAADVVAREHELVTSIDAARAAARSIDTRAAALLPAIDAAARQLRRDEIALALGTPGAAPALFALPASAGGMLETAREVLIEAITGLQAIGQGDTAAATQRLVAGDAHYNAGRLADAWREFAAGYRALDPHVGGGSP